MLCRVQKNKHKHGEILRRQTHENHEQKARKASPQIRYIKYIVASLTTVKMHTEQICILHERSHVAPPVFYVGLLQSLDSQMFFS